MATNFTVRHSFDISVDDFWPKVFFDKDYGRRLYLEALEFKQYDVVEEKRLDDGTITRTVRMEPKSDAPPIVTKLVGGSLTYREIGRFDPKSKRWKYEIVLDKLTDKASIGGEFWAESRGDNKIERLCSVKIEIKVFGVGGAIESFIEKKTREDYDKAAEFTRKWIAKL